MSIPSPLTLLPRHKLLQFGLQHAENIHYQSSPEDLVDDTLRLNEGVLDENGALVIHTGEFTGRSPKDKFIVKDSITENTVNWNDFNIPIAEKYFDIIFKKIIIRLSLEFQKREQCMLLRLLHTQFQPNTAK